MRPNRERLRDLAAIIESDLEALRKLSLRLDQWAPGSAQIAPGSSEAYSTAMLLHHTYNAIENLLRQTLRVFGETLPQVEHWHRLLLLQMLTATADRPAIFDSSLGPIIEELLRFRHRVRHSYDYDLDTGKLSQLIGRWRSRQEEVFHAIESFRGVMVGLLDSPES